MLSHTHHCRHAPRLRRSAFKSFSSQFIPIVCAAILAMMAHSPAALAQSNPSCYADCDVSTGAGNLDIFDFLCFQSSFVNGETYACDCDVSTGPAVCDIFDFLCFQNAFVTGCQPHNLNPPGTLPGQGGQPLPSGDRSARALPMSLVGSAHLFSGEFHTNMTDMTVRGRGFDFVWKRTYRSIAGPDTAMGEKWDFSYNIFLEANGTHLDLHNGNARFDTYFLQPNGTWSRPEYFRELRQNATGYELIQPDASRWNFHPLNGSATAGMLKSIIDRNGNAMTFDYDTNGRLITITDTLDQPTAPNLRRQYTIEYYPGTDLIRSLEDYTGRQVVYEYYQSGQIGGSPGQLKSARSPIVTGSPGSPFPNGKTTTYTYEPAVGGVPGKLAAITDPKGQEFLINSYDAATGRLVRQQLGDPGDLINISYAAVSPNAQNNESVVKAIVNDRVGNVSEAFFDDHNRCVILRNYTGRWDPDLPTPDPSNPPTAKLRAGDPGFYETRYVYNDDALATSVLYPNLNEHRFEYDETNPSPIARGNLLVSRELPGPLGGDQMEIVERFEYLDWFGKSNSCCGTAFVTKWEDGRGNVKTFEYDGVFNLIATTDRIPSITNTYTYNEFGQMTSHLLPRNDILGYKTRRLDTFAYHLAESNQGSYQYGYLRSRTVDQLNLKLQTQYEYNDRGIPHLITDPRGATDRYEINELDQFVLGTRRTIQQPIPHTYVTEYFHDANNNIVQINVENRDDTGALLANRWFTTSFEHDILDFTVRTTQEVDPSHAVVTEYAYDENRNQTLVRFGEATNGNDFFNTVNTRYDERDLVFQETRAPGHPDDQSTTQYDYDANANVAAVHEGIETHPHTTTSMYDGYDRLISQFDPMGNVTQYHYDPNSNLGGDAAPGSPNPFAIRVMGELVDVSGSTSNIRLSETMSQYDAMDRLITETVAFFDTTSQAPLQGGHALGESQTRWTYTDTSQLRSIEDDRSNVTKFAYDTANRLAGTTDAAGNSVVNIYDANSNITHMIESEISQGGAPNQIFGTHLEYDGVDRLISSTDNVGNTTTYHYDSRDNLLRTVDPLQHTVRYDYDGLNRLVETHREEDIDLGQSWDDTSRLIGQTDDSKNTTSYSYDSLNRLVATVYEDCTQHVSQYNAHDNVVTTTDANGTVCDMMYDELDRMFQKDVSKFAPGVSQDTTFETVSYDGLSRLVEAKDDDSLVLYAHDSMSNVTDETLFIGRPFQNGGTTTSLFDGVGNKVWSMYPGGRQLTRTFEDLNRMRQVSDQQGSIASYTYIGPGRVERRTYGNGTATDYTYDGISGIANSPNDFGVKRIVRTRHTGPTGIVDDRTYTWDKLYNKTQRKDVRAVGPGLTHDYMYDAEYRLTSTLVTDRANNTVRKTSYDLDGVGNRDEVLGMPDPGPYVGPYTLIGDLCDPPADEDMNQYTTTPFDAREYDKNGNLVRRKLPGGGSTMAEIAYDYRNRMVEYKDLILGQRHTYAYDAFGRRIARVVDADGVAGGPTETRYFYDGWQVCEERNAAGATQATYVYGLYIDEVLNMQRAGNNFFYHTDDLYNVMAITNAAGSVVERYEYQDYGQPELFNASGNPIPKSAIANPYLFTGRRNDPETDWYYYRTRYLNPCAGRFTTRDTIGIWGDTGNVGSGYAYVSNNPMTWTDATGAIPPGIWGDIADLEDFIRMMIRMGAPAATIAALRAKLHLMLHSAWWWEWFPEAYGSASGGAEAGAASVGAAIWVGLIAGYVYIVWDVTKDYPDWRADQRRRDAEAAWRRIWGPIIDEYNRRWIDRFWEEEKDENTSKYWTAKALEDIKDYQAANGPIYLPGSIGSRGGIWRDHYGRIRGNWGGTWGSSGLNMVDDELESHECAK